MNTDYQPKLRDITRRIKRLQRVRQAVYLVRGAGLTILVLGVVFTVLAAGDHLYRFPLLLRVAAAAAFYALLCVLTHRWLLRARRSYGDLERTAAAIEAAHGEMDQSLVGSVEFTEGSAKGRAGQAFVEGMVSDAYTQARHVRLRDLVRPRDIALAACLLLAPLAVLALGLWLSPQWTRTYASRLLAPGLIEPPPLGRIAIEVTPGDISIPKGAPLTLAATLGRGAPETIVLMRRAAGEAHWQRELLPRGDAARFIKALDRVERPFEYRFAVGRDTTPAFRVRLIVFPEIERFAIDYDFPDYTGRTNRTVESATGDISALRGTTARVTVRCDKPIARAVLRIDGRDPMPIDAGGKPVFRFDHVVDASTRYRLEFVDTDGNPGSSPSDYAITAQDDAAPTVEVTLPEDNVRATVVSEVPVAFSASDDYGFASVRLRYLVDDRPEQVVDFPADGRKQFEAEHVFHIENMNLRPGSEILFSVEAIDNNTWGEPRRAVTEMLFIMVQHFKNEAMLLMGEGGGLMGVKHDLVAMQRAVVRKTWPYADEPDFGRTATNALRGIAADQRKVREKAEGALAEARALQARSSRSAPAPDASSAAEPVTPDAIAALEKAIAHMNKAAAALDQTRPDRGFQSERFALAALLEAYAYEIGIVESGTGSAGADPDAEKKMEEVTIRVSTGEGRQPDPDAAALAENMAQELARLHMDQSELARDLAAAAARETAPPGSETPDGEPAPSAPPPPDDADPRAGPLADRLNATERLQQMRGRQERIEAETGLLAGEASLQADDTENGEAFGELREALESAREHMREATETLMREAPPVSAAEAARTASEAARDDLERALQTARDMAPPDPGQALEEMVAQLEAMRARMELAEAGAEPPAFGETAGELQDLARRATEAGQEALARQAEAAAGQLEQMAQETSEPSAPGESDAPGAPADANQPPQETPGGQGTGSGTTAPEAREDAPPDAAPPSPADTRKPGPTQGVGANFGEEVAEATPSARRLLDELVEAFSSAPMLANRKQRRVPRRDEPVVDYRTPENTFYRRISQEAVPPGATETRE